MRTTTTEDLLGLVDAMPSDRFTAEDLLGRASATYDQLQEMLFELLASPQPALRQVFDRQAKQMLLERLGR